MLEAQLLTEMNEGRLRIDPITLDVYVLHGGWGKWHRKALQRHPKSGRARFMFGPRRTPVYRNRLVWIWTHRRLPSGNIDHKDGDRLNDHPDNLQEHTKEESDRQGYDVQQDKALRRLCDWFDFIAIAGYPPD